MNNENKQQSKENTQDNNKKSTNQQKDNSDFEQQETFNSDLHKQAFGKSKSGKDYIRESVKVTLENSKTFEDFLKRLTDQHIQIYRIDDTFGFIDIQTNWKYRLHTLGLEAEFENFILKTKQPKSFKDKIKDFGKRLFHEVVNDAEHLITGKKPELEDEIWTQEEAGNLKTDTKKNYRQVYTKASELNNDELAKTAFKKKMQEARKTSEKNKEKTKDNESRFEKK